MDGMPLPSLDDLNIGIMSGFKKLKNHHTVLNVLLNNFPFPFNTCCDLSVTNS